MYQITGLVFALTLLAVYGRALAEAPSGVEPTKCCGASKVHVSGSIYLAGQPDENGLRRAAKAGIRTVINLRESTELDWDERAVVESLEMSYHHVPFHSPEGLTNERITRARSLLRDAKNHPLLLHCASANRVGAIWLAYRVLDEGVTFEQALDEARTVGLRTEGYVQRVREYINQTRS